MNLSRQEKFSILRDGLRLWTFLNGLHSMKSHLMLSEKDIACLEDFHRLVIPQVPRYHHRFAIDLDNCVEALLLCLEFDSKPVVNLTYGNIWTLVQRFDESCTSVDMEQLSHCDNMLDSSNLSLDIIKLEPAEFESETDEHVRGEDSCGDSSSVKAEHSVEGFETVCVQQKGSKKSFMCFTCMKVFGSPAQLRQHERSHSNPAEWYVCSDCGKRFAWRQNFARHRSALHGDDIRAVSRLSSVPVPQVEVEMQNTDLLRAPEDGVTESFDPDDISKNGRESSCIGELSEPTTNSNMKSFAESPQEQCLVFSNKLTPLSQKAENGFALSPLETGDCHSLADRSYDCQTCGKKFTKQMLLYQHRRVHSNPNDWFTCGDCRKGFAWRQNFVRHCISIHGDSYTKARSRFHRKSSTEPRLVKSSHFDERECLPFVCMTCEKRFSDRWLLRQHERLHSDPDNWYVCRDCDKRYAWRQNLFRHRMAVHGDSRADAFSYAHSQSDGQFEVTNADGVCQQTANSEVERFAKPALMPEYDVSIEEHILEPAGHDDNSDCAVIDCIEPNDELNQNVCDELPTIDKCKPSVATKSNGRNLPKDQRAVSHVRTKRSLDFGEQAFHCPTCGKTFAKHYLLRQHARLHSNPDEWYICSDCGKRFAWRQNFMRHRVSVH